MMMRKVITAGGVAAASVCATLLCVEVALRIVGYDPFGNLAGGRLILRESANRDMIYEMTPDSQGLGWGTDISINSAGFRDREYRLDKPEGVHRIVAIGDSITFGNYLPLEATYPEQLERALVERGVRAEVLNLGVGGYDISQEVAFLEDRGLPFDPDSVILGYCMNDIGVVSLNLAYIKRAKNYDSVIYRSRVMQFVRSRLDILQAKFETSQRARAEQKQKGRTGNSYVDSRMQQISEQIGRGGEYDSTLSWYLVPSKLEKLRRGFAKLHEHSREHGFTVSVVIIPYLHKRDPTYEAAYEIVSYEASRHGFTVIEVLEEFEDAGIERLRIRPSDGVHPNERGHRIIAKELLELYTGEAYRSKFSN